MANLAAPKLQPRLRPKLTGVETPGAQNLISRNSRNCRNSRNSGKNEDHASSGLWRDVDDDKEAAEPAFRPLTHDQAQALRRLHPSVSPWRVVGFQAGVGLVAALILALSTGQQVWVWSFLYGAATVVLPGALMARGISSPLARKSAGAGVVSFLVWESVKVGVAVVMLVLAPQLVQPLSWPALLAGLVLCLKCYWVALLWRGSKKN